MNQNNQIIIKNTYYNKEEQIYNKILNVIDDKPTKSKNSNLESV